VSIQSHPIVPGYIPPLIGRVLQPHERRVIIVRQHPAVLVAPILTAVGWLIAASVLSFLDLSGAALGALWAAWGLTAAYLLVRLARWPGSYLVVTSQRLLLTRGFPSRDIVTVPLARATELGLRRSFLGRLLGYGHFILYGAGRRQAIKHANFIPYPEQLYLEVVGLIFRGDQESEEAD
jgi:uncharacterized membrane protein YdbT with pleckstrin-like domain